MHIVLGPPGTGKTTKLLNLVEQYMQSGVLQKIGLILGIIIQQIMIL